MDELLTRSMLQEAAVLSKKYARKLWQYCYSQPQYQTINQIASVWLDIYPLSQLLGKNKTSILETLCDAELFSALETLGIKVIHTNPTSEAGGLTPALKSYPSTDGGYDRISYDVAKIYGTNEQYRQLVILAAQHGMFIAADVIPGHTGKGADFRLAEINYADYANLYSMIEIDAKDWQLLPQVTAQEDSKNLSVAQEQLLVTAGYLPGILDEVIFYAPGIKETNWSATREVVGVDGITRRWVYLHLFKENQPTLNWLDASFAAYHLISGDLLKTRFELGAKLVRLDATFNLAIEKTENSAQIATRGHKLGNNVTQQLAQLMRNFDGWSYEENCATLDSLKERENGADLFYDFATRTGVFHALITGDAKLLRLQQELLLEYQIDPRRLIHAMQNHDNISYELIHLTQNKDKLFKFGDKKLTGAVINDLIFIEVKDFCAKNNLVFDYGFGGILTNLVNLCAARCGDDIKKLMLLLFFYNAMQPGVVQISAWDLLGAMTLDRDLINKFATDGDLRWLARGGYDLLEKSDKIKSEFAVPRSTCLFGSISEQLQDSASFASGVKNILARREELKIAQAELIKVFDIADYAVYSAAYQLSGNFYLVLINFAAQQKEFILDFHGSRSVKLPAFGTDIVIIQK